MTLHEIHVLERNDTRCTAHLGRLRCVLPAAHSTGHVCVHESMTADRKAG
jgi:hypothetical protein